MLFRSLCLHLNVTAQLAPIATSNTLSAGVDATPGMDDANGATLTDKSTTIPAGYSADPASGRLTFGIWNLKSYNETYNTNYYVTLSVDKTTSTNNPDVYVRLVDKSTGKDSICYLRDYQGLLLYLS